MKCSIIGLIAIAICFLQFIRDFKCSKKLFEHSFLLCIISTIFLDIGYVFKIGSFYFEYNYLFSIYSFFCLVIYLIKDKMSLKFLKYIIYFTLFVVFSIGVKFLFDVEYISCSFNQSWDTLFLNNELEKVRVDFSGIFIIIRLVIFLILVSAFSINCNIERIDYISNKLFMFSKIYFVLILIEIISINVINNYSIREIYFFLFGKTEYSYVYYRKFFGIICPMGFAREPSNLALSILYIIVNCIYVCFRKNKGKILCLSFFSVSLLIGSSSAYLYSFAVIFLLLFIFMRKYNKRMIGNFTILLSPLVLLIIFFVFYVTQNEKINDLLSSFTYFKPDNIEGLDMKSTIIRFYSIYNICYYWLKNLFLGVGIGTIYSFSSIFTLIVNLGIIGTILFYRIYRSALIKSCKISIGKKSEIYYLLFMFLCFSFTGHMSYIAYFEKTFFMSLELVLIFNSNYLEKKKYDLCYLSA